MFTIKDTILSGDLNNYRDMAIRSLGSGITNLPSGGEWGTLFVLPSMSSQSCMQMIFRPDASGGIFMRRWHYVDGWTQWFKASIA